MYKIFETDQFSSDLKILRGKIYDKIDKKIRSYIYPQLRENPFFGNNIKKLKNWKPETWRYRIGDYRLFYEINDTENVVYITAFELREDAY